jgi:fused signal recognition particle receptor
METETAPKKGFFQKIKDSLSKTRQTISNSLEGVFKRFSSISEELFEELEEILILSDMGAPTAMELVEKLRKRVKAEHVTDVASIKGLLADEIAKLLEGDTPPLVYKSPTVLLVLGVNGRENHFNRKAHKPPEV